jgi:hypothetical protein
VAITAPETDMIQKDKCHYIYAAILETSKIYSDLIVIFPKTSLSRNKYISMLYDYDSSSVLSALMKNRGYKEMA